MISYSLMGIRNVGKEEQRMLGLEVALSGSDRVHLGG